jgi:hypothetical protein
MAPILVELRGLQILRILPYYDYGLGEGLYRIKQDFSLIQYAIKD